MSRHILVKLVKQQRIIPFQVCLILKPCPEALMFAASCEYALHSHRRVLLNISLLECMFAAMPHKLGSLLRLSPFEITETKMRVTCFLVAYASLCLTGVLQPSGWDHWWGSLTRYRLCKSAERDQWYGLISSLTHTWDYSSSSTLPTFIIKSWAS